MATTTAPTRGARVIFIPPPLYYAAGLAAGMLLDHLARFPLGGRPATVIAGAVIGAAGLALAFSGVAGVIRHRTTIVPHRPVAALITGGAYRLTRNPMYAGLAVAYLGAALALGSGWPLLLWPLVVLAVDRLVIRPEERYLAARFGPAYAEYRTRARRWL
jgi:protein-S-isoprenylcysteine O-methyltransferase Ste14